MKNQNKTLFITLIALCCAFLAFAILINRIRDKQKEDQKNIEKFNYSNNSWLPQLSIPFDSEVKCLKKIDFPENLNILNNLNNSIFLEILNYLKQDIIDQDAVVYNPQNNSITFHIKPNLQFENGELITAETLKYTLKIYIDCGLAKDLLDKLDKIIDYDIEYRETEKNKIFDDLIKIDNDQKITIKLKKNVSPSVIIDFLNKKIFLISLKYYQFTPDTQIIKNHYGSQQKLLSYGDYKIFQFIPQDMKLWLQTNPNVNKHNKKENIFYLAASKKDQRDLFKSGQISVYEPLEDIEEDISYNDSLWNEEFLANNDYHKEFQLDDLQLFLIFNLTTKENYLKHKMLEQLNYFYDYFSKKSSQEEMLTIKSTISFINDNHQESAKYDKYSSCLRDIFLKDKGFLTQQQNKLEKWKSIKIPHAILQDYDFRKAVYLVFNREQIIKDIFPFYKPSCHPISELSEFNAIKNKNMLTNIFAFLGLEQSSAIDQTALIKSSFKETQAKDLFNQAWSKLPLEQQKPIILKTKYFLDDKRFEMIFKYFKNRIETVFDNKIILEPCLTKNTNILAEIIEKNEQGENISSIIEDIDDNSDLFIDCYHTSDFMYIMFILLTKFYCNYSFDIDFSEELTPISREEQKMLQSSFRYASKEFLSIDEHHKLKGDVDLINAFFLNKVKNSSLQNEIKQKISFKLLRSLEKKYFETLPAIPFFALQKSIISKNKQ
ncbi:ABC transporter substrate-binding protein [Mulberry dwarf phytoplasma]|uniref:ABC transporter substrate-binding protein n=1 Tax=Mulberry dwarf phytoplasma TaxID=186171 RepID=UPI001D12BF6E|nr:ABC transporter substrate-binding protein [Mulberry dwarf phytoplasma]